MYRRDTSVLAKTLYTPLFLGSKYISHYLKFLRFVHFSLLTLVECSSREMKFQAGPKQSANQSSSFFGHRDILGASGFTQQQNSTLQEEQNK